MKHIPFFSFVVLSLLLLASCTGRKETLYREALAEARRQNLSYEPVTGDSLLRCAVDELRNGLSQFDSKRAA